MFVTEGAYTRKVASEVGAGLKYLFQHPDDDRYLDLALVCYHPDGNKEWTERIRLLPKREDRVVTLANGREIVRCMNSDGKKLDIIFGDIAVRELEPALVIIES